MTLIIIKIVLFILLIRIIFLTIGHLVIVFYKDATKMAVKEIMKDPEDFVRSEHICKFMNNMIWFAIFIQLLIAAYNGRIIIN